MTSRFIILLAILLFSCSSETAVKQPKHYSSPFFTLVDAEGILGEPAHIQSTGRGHGFDSGGETTEYASNDTNNATGKLSVVSFSYETYGRLSDAKKRYVSSLSGIDDGQAPDGDIDFGDEGYVYRYRFYLMVRKYDTILTIDAPNLTGRISTDSLLQVARRIVERL
jgi:hypothetical protein